MDVKKHVIDYETAMGLKKAGVKQDSLFYWCFPEGATKPQLMNFSIYDFKHDATFQAHLKHNECAAFTLSEIMDLLPGRNLGSELRQLVNELQQNHSPSV